MKATIICIVSVIFFVILSVVLFYLWLLIFTAIIPGQPPPFSFQVVLWIVLMFPFTLLAVWIITIRNLLKNRNLGMYFLIPVLYLMLIILVLIVYAMFQ